MKKISHKIAILLTTAFVLTGCLPSAEGNPTAGNQTTSEPMGQITSSSTSQITRNELPVVEVTINMSNHRFSPNTISAKPGQRVRINLQNVFGTHDLVIDELNVASRILNGNSSQVLEFTIPENASGRSYEFYCSVANHRELGMIGTLRVE